MEELWRLLDENEQEEKTLELDEEDGRVLGIHPQGEKVFQISDKTEESKAQSSISKVGDVWQASVSNIAEGTTREKKTLASDWNGTRSERTKISDRISFAEREKLASLSVTNFQGKRKVETGLREQMTMEGMVEKLPVRRLLGERSETNTSGIRDVVRVGDVTAGVLMDMADVLNRKRDGDTVRVILHNKERSDAVIQANESARTLYHQVRMAQLRSVEMPNRGLIVSVEERTEGTAIGMREMDRAVQRDARRYDGGFGLL